MKFFMKFKYFNKLYFLKKKLKKSWRFVQLSRSNNQFLTIFFFFLKKNYSFFFFKKKANFFFFKSINELKLAVAKSLNFSKKELQSALQGQKRNFTKKSKVADVSTFSLKNIRHLSYTIKQNRYLQQVFFLKKKKLTKKKLTLKLKNFISLPSVNCIQIFEFSISTILLRSHLVLSNHQVIDVLKNNYVYANGRLVKHPFIELKVQEAVQLVLTKSYYIYILYNYNLSLKWAFRVGYCLWRFYRYKFNLFKQSPKNLPKWLFNLIFFKQPIPSHLEVDFSILTVYVLNLPTQYTMFTKKLFSTNFLRLLNWKQST